jgi:glycosyltransferase involved in cell wall biosynthesis
MRVVYDARTIRQGMTGVGGFTRGLLRGLMRIDNENEYFCLLNEADQWAPLAAPDNFHPIVVRADYERHPAGDLWEHFALPRLLKRQQADLFHGPAFSIPWRAKCKSLVTIHDLVAFLHPHTHPARFSCYLRWVTRGALRHAAGVAVDAEATRRDLTEQLSVDPKRVRVIPGGVDEEFQPPPPKEVERWLAERELARGYILFVGAVEPRKNLPTLLRAYQRLIGDGQADCQLVIVGRWGWGSEEARTLLENLPAKERVVQVGYAPRRELPLYYASAAALAFPSLYEGFGLPLLEAMACGAPVVAADSSSLPEVVGDAGLLCPPTAEAAWAQALARVLNDSRLATDLAAKGRARAAQFSWERTARETLAFYQALAD